MMMTWLLEEELSGVDNGVLNHRLKGVLRQQVDSVEGVAEMMRGARQL